MGRGIIKLFIGALIVAFLTLSVGGCEDIALRDIIERKIAAANLGDLGFSLCPVIPEGSQATFTMGNNGGSANEQLRSRKPSRRRCYMVGFCSFL